MWTWQGYLMSVLTFRTSKLTVAVGNCNCELRVLTGRASMHACMC